MSRAPALTPGEVLDAVLTPAEDRRGARVVHHEVLLRREREGEGDELLVLAAAVEVPMGTGGATACNARIVIGSRHRTARGEERTLAIRLNDRAGALAVHAALGRALGLAPHSPA